MKMNPQQLANKLANTLRPSLKRIMPPTREKLEALCEAADRYQQLAVEACNRELTKSEQEEDASLEAKIREIVFSLPKVKNPLGVPSNILPRLGGDPRGACVKLVMPDGRYDSWGGPSDGICVPTNDW